MFDTIIVGVDGSDGGRDALALADTLQRAFGSAIIGVTAYPSYDFPRRAEHETVVERDATAYLREEVRRAGVGARTVAIPDGSPARALHDVAEREHADLIVVGSDHGTPIGHVLVGDVTSSTLYGSPVAVAVAPRGLASRDRTLASVGVGYDGFPESMHALELGRRIADAAHAQLEVIAVTPPPVALGPWASQTVRMDDSEYAELEQTMALAQNAAAGSPRATAHVMVGAVAVELARRSGKLDLLVVGSRGYGPMRRLLLGSTSSRLVHTALCPIIVLPRGARTETAPEPAMAGASSWRIRPDQLP
jgi:nucleotide-binding universal stress UspA family protein